MSIQTYDDLSPEERDKADDIVAACALALWCCLAALAVVGAFIAYEMGRAYCFVHSFGSLLILSGLIWAYDKWKRKEAKRLGKG